MATSIEIGDMQTEAVQPLVVQEPLPITTEAKLLAITDPINITLYSGKKAGALYAYTPTLGDPALGIVIATGSAADADWIDITSGAAITPV